jgi:transposase InsO family protein
MSIISDTAGLRIIDAMAIVFSQALQLARVRIASTASPVLRMVGQRDHAVSEAELLRREVGILRSQRVNVPPHRRHDYSAEQRLVILQLMRLRGWSAAVVAERFVLHVNTVRSWIAAIEGRGNERLLASTIVWNRLDDLVRWAVHGLRHLCPEREIGTRTIARHLVRAGIAVSRTTVQRVLRDPRPTSGKPRPRHPSPVAVGIAPHHLLRPTQINQVWHLDLTTLRVLWFRFVVAAVLDGFTRRLLALRVYRCTPRTAHLVALVRNAIAEHGLNFRGPHFIITDHGCQFRRQFKAAMKRMGIQHVQGRVRQPFLNGKVERLFRSFRGRKGDILLFHLLPSDGKKRGHSTFPPLAIKSTFRNQQFFPPPPPRKC